MIEELIVKKMQAAEKAALIATTLEAAKQVKSVASVTGLSASNSKAVLGAAYVRIGAALSASSANLSVESGEAMEEKLGKYQAALMLEALDQAGDAESEFIASVEAIVASATAA